MAITMSKSVSLLFLVTTFVWSDPKQRAAVYTSPGGWDLTPTVVGNRRNADGNASSNFPETTTGSSGSSPHITTDVLDNETTISICSEGNSNGPDCHGSADEVAIVDRVDTYLTFIIGVSINRYVLPVIIVVGTFGNLVSTFVMFQRHNRHTSFSIYLGNLAISDNCVLYGAAYYWVVSEIEGRPFTDVECKIIVWILTTFQENGVLLILSVTLDRLVAVRFPLRAAAWCRARRAKIVSVSVFAIVSAYNIPHLVLNQSDEQLVCKLCNFNNILCILHSWMTIFLAFAVPFVLLLSMNTVIIRAVRNAMKYQTSHSVDKDKDTTTTESIEVNELSVQSATQSTQAERPSERNKTQLSSKDRNLIAMLILVSFMFLFLNAPRFVRNILFFTVRLEPTPEGTALNLLVFHITNKLYLFNNACNFFLYCFSGSKFRRDCAKLFREHFLPRCCKNATNSKPP